MIEVARSCEVRGTRFGHIKIMLLVGQVLAVAQKTVVRVNGFQRRAGGISRAIGLLPRVVIGIGIVIKRVVDIRLSAYPIRTGAPIERGFVTRISPGHEVPCH